MNNKFNEQEKTHRGHLIWLGCSVLLMVGHLWFSSSLWKFGIPAGEVVWGGPGDGLYFLFFLLGPWFFIQLLNVGLVIAGFVNGMRQKQWRSLFLNGGIFGAWIVVGVVESLLIKCPAGVTCTSG